MRRDGVSLVRSWARTRGIMTTIVGWATAESSPQTAVLTAIPGLGGAPIRQKSYGRLVNEELTRIMRQGWRM